MAKRPGELTAKRSGQYVHISDGVDVVTLKASSRPMADRLIAKLEFLQRARPELRPAQVLERALFEIECWDRFRQRRWRGGVR